MPPAPFPDPDPDAPEPPGSRPVPDGGNDGAPEPPWSDEQDSAAYLGELMAAAAAGEELTTKDISGAGFTPPARTPPAPPTPAP